MMKIFIKNSVLVIVLFFGQEAIACDFCSLLDYGNINNQTSFRIDYKYRLFSGYNQNIPSIGTGSNAARQGIAFHRGIPGQTKTYINHKDDYELYRIINLGFVYNHKDHLNLILNLPYLTNIDYYGLVIPDIGSGQSESNRYKGFGDLNIGLQKIIVREKEIIKHTIKLSGMLFLPTGKYKVIDILTSNLHMQPGRSIYASELGANYTFENTGIWGINTNANYYIPFSNNSLSKYNTYYFAKRLQIDLQAFKVFNGDIKKIIIGGIKTEFNDSDYINQYIINDSGYKILYATAGLTLKYKKSLVSVSYDLPLIQKINGLQLKTQKSFGISYIQYLKKSDKK